MSKVALREQSVERNASNVLEEVAIEIEFLSQTVDETNSRAPIQKLMDCTDQHRPTVEAGE